MTSTTAEMAPQMYQTCCTICLPFFGLTKNTYNWMLLTIFNTKKHVGPYTVWAQYRVMGSLLLKEVSFHYFITVYCPPGDKVDVSSYVVGQDAPFPHGHPTKKVARRWLHCYLALVLSFKHFSIVVYTKRPSVAPGCRVQCDQVVTIWER